MVSKQNFYKTFPFNFDIGEIKDDEMIKVDFRKALRITFLSVISTLVTVAIFYVI